ncbi:MAG: Mur ligase family protein [Minisyncoccia bacterium]
MAKKAHFIGIAGMGMSAVAFLLKEQGWDVSGSDTEVYAPATTQLERHDISLSTPYDPTNIPNDADLIVIGKNAKLARADNTEVAAAYDSVKRIASFPEILGEITADRETIVATGSYGKSTTTTLLAWLLSKSGVDAGWFIGASPSGLEPAHLGTHPTFVLEGDEYPTSHDDARPKFAHYGAHDAIVTAASHDHVNIYKTHDEFLSAFRSLVKSLPEDGIAMLCADEPFARRLAEHTSARVVSYGFDHSATWRAQNIERGEVTSFDLIHSGEKVVGLSTRLIGDHNIQNIVGASALLLEKKLITPNDIARALPEFEGLARRLDKKTLSSLIPAHEGFGSSREKLRAAISAMRSQYPEKRLVVVFEPHTFSWRNKNMLHWFDDAFEGANLVILYKPAEQGSSTHEQSSQEDMAARLSAAGIDVRSVSEPDEVMELLSKETRDGDTILLSSSGPMDGLIERIPEWLDRTFSD